MQFAPVKLIQMRQHHFTRMRYSILASSRALTVTMYLNVLVSSFSAQWLDEMRSQLPPTGSTTSTSTAPVETGAGWLVNRLVLMRERSRGGKRMQGRG